MSARPKEPTTERRLRAAAPIPELGGVSAGDIRFAAHSALRALGVNIGADNGAPTAATVLEHAIHDACAAIDMVLETMEDSSAPHLVLLGVRERLLTAADSAGVLSKLNASEGATPAAEHGGES